MKRLLFGLATVALAGALREVVGVAARAAGVRSEMRKYPSMFDSATAAATVATLVEEYRREAGL